MATEKIIEINDAYGLYLRDESSREGTAESISFPVSYEDIGLVINSLDPETRITFQGARTGYEGRAVPDGGHIMNLSGMNRILDSGMKNEKEAYITVEAGVTLEQLETEIDRRFKRKFFWPPSPTEKTATIGGIAATDAHGMNSCYYGETSQYITSLKRFGDKKSGPIAELELRLLQRPENIWGIVFFFDREDKAVSCADKLRSFEIQSSKAWIASMEYMNHAAITMARELEGSMKGRTAAPPFPDETDSLIYIEIEGEEEEIEMAAIELMALAGDCGSDPDTALALTGIADTSRMHLFRHAVTEAAVSHAAAKHAYDDRITKLGIRSTHNGASITDVLAYYAGTLEAQQLKYAVCVQIRDTETDISLLPDNFEEYCRGKAIVESEARYE